MPEFKTLPEAFEWFLENIYPKLPTEQKTPLRAARHSFYKEGKKVSEKRMKRILDEHSNYENVHRIGFSKK